VIETAVEITRGEVRSHESSKVPATSPRGIGKNTDAAALLEGGQDPHDTRRYVQSPVMQGAVGIKKKGPGWFSFPATAC
jgi:hypothetical protein